MTSLRRFSPPIGITLIFMSMYSPAILFINQIYLLFILCFLFQETRKFSILEQKRDQLRAQASPNGNVVIGGDQLNVKMYVHHPLQSTTSPSSKYHTTLFKATHHPLQSTTSPSLQCKNVCDET